MSISNLSVRDARIVLSAVAEPGDSQVHALVTRRGPADALEHLLASNEDTPPVKAAQTRLGGSDPARLAADLVERGAACGARVVIPGEDEWPHGLDDLATLDDSDDAGVRPPTCLWVRGPHRLADALMRSVTIAGARCCTPYGRRVATDIAFGLAQRGWTVVSGGSYGIDAAAHQGALAGDGVTVSVLACGVDRPYPAANANLFDRITETGLLVSEWPPGAVPMRHRLLTRNRCLAAMTRGTVVVEAAMRSGARHIAKRAADLGRPVLIVPGPVTSEHSAGVHTLARDLPDVRIVTRASEVIDDLTISS